MTLPYGNAGNRGHAVSNLVDVEAELHGETDRAYRLDAYGTIKWVPKSQVQDNEDGTFSMPEWLAKENGFI